MPDHVAYECPPGCAGCQFCTGGLMACTQCSGAEGSLTTDCPRTKYEDQMVYQGGLDYTVASGWHLREKTTVCGHVKFDPGWRRGAELWLRAQADPPIMPPGYPHVLAQGGSRDSIVLHLRDLDYARIGPKAAMRYYVAEMLGRVSVATQQEIMDSAYPPMRKLRENQSPRIFLSLTWSVRTPPPEED